MFTSMAGMAFQCALGMHFHSLDFSLATVIGPLMRLARGLQILNASCGHRYLESSWRQMQAWSYPIT